VREATKYAFEGEEKRPTAEAAILRLLRVPCASFSSASAAAAAVLVVLVTVDLRVEEGDRQNTRNSPTEPARPGAKSSSPDASPAAAGSLD
jgi:hypothetical protein